MVEVIVCRVCAYMRAPLLLLCLALRRCEERKGILPPIGIGLVDI
jgi:hypothetical protein